jgi:predicted oxidoreductase
MGLPRCASEDPGILPKKGRLASGLEPPGPGVLTGNLDAQPDKIRKTAGLVQEYARRHETTAEGILLAWLLNHPAKIQPVLGTTTRNRLRACAKFP